MLIDSFISFMLMILVCECYFFCEAILFWSLNEWEIKIKYAKIYFKVTNMNIKKIVSSQDLVHQMRVLMQYRQYQKWLILITHHIRFDRLQCWIFDLIHFGYFSSLFAVVSQKATQKESQYLKLPTLSYVNVRYNLF